MKLVDIEFDDAVEEEFQSQLTKWGVQDHPDGTSIDNTAIADAARAACDDAARNGHLTWKDIALEEFMEALAEEDPDKLVTELIQTAAVLKSWIDCIQRREGFTPHIEYPKQVTA